MYTYSFVQIRLTLLCIQAQNKLNTVVFARYYIKDIHTCMHVTGYDTYSTLGTWICQYEQM